MFAKDKLATDPPVSEAQRKAMWAAAKGHSTLGIPKTVDKEFVSKDSNVRASGTLLLTKDGKALFLKRNKSSDCPGDWALPGGIIEEGEDCYDAAVRELREETGADATVGKLKFHSRTVTPLGDNCAVDFSTYVQGVDKTFEPTLDGENVGHAWVPLREPPHPLHPGVRHTLDSMMPKGKDMTDEEWDSLLSNLMKWIEEEESEAEHAEDTLALDYAGSQRHTDVDGRLHVASTNISKSNVCGYYGSEIPNSTALGLLPDRMYQLYRDPVELEKAADTFNNIPLLEKHVAVNAQDPQKDLVIGSTGTDAKFQHPYLTNSLVVWTQDAIDAIEQGTQRELSCCYRYQAEMTPGMTPDGMLYDGIMRNIIGNHVALVEKGRAGPDVMVQDSALPDLKECFIMPQVTLSRKAVLAHGALLVFLRPQLAKDAQVDLAPMLKDVTKANYKDSISTLVDGVTAATKGKLAKDAKLDGLKDVLLALDGDMGDDDPPEFEGKPEKDAKDEKDDDDDDEEKKKKKADDEKDDDDKKKSMDVKKPAVDKEAMDAAIGTAVTTAVLQERKNQKAIREAMEIVRPYVGTLAMDAETAEDVYKGALTALSINVKDVHPSAYKTILELQPLPGTKNKQQPKLSMDADSVKGFAERYPDAARVTNV